MNIEIHENFAKSLYGFSGVAEENKWSDKGMELMNKMWQVVKSHKLGNLGINIWVYEDRNLLFTGVELRFPPPPEIALELKQVFLPRYVYYKHIGPYNKIGESCIKVREQLDNTGMKVRMPYLEIYGHWVEDPSKLETELLWSLD